MQREKPFEGSCNMQTESCWYASCQTMRCSINDLSNTGPLSGLTQCDFSVLRCMVGRTVNSLFLLIYKYHKQQPAVGVYLSCSALTKASACFPLIRVSIVLTITWNHNTCTVKLYVNYLALNLCYA